MLLDEHEECRHESINRTFVVGDGHHGDNRVAVGILHRQPELDEVTLDVDAMGAGSGKQQHELGGLHSRAGEHGESLDLAESLPSPGDQRDDVVHEARPLKGKQGACCIDAGEDRRTRTRRVRRLESGIESGRIQSLGARQQDRALGEGGQCLVRTGDDGVSTDSDRMWGQQWMLAEVGGPRTVDDKGDVHLMCDLGDSSEVTGRSDVGRVDRDDSDSMRMQCQGAAYLLSGDAHGQTGAVVELRPQPRGLQPCEHQPGEQ